MNLNLWLPAITAWTMVLTACCAAAVLGRMVTGVVLTKDAAGFVAAGAVASMVLAWLWLRMFGTNYLWLLQGDGNDLLYFFGGAAWASEYPQFVAQDGVSDAFNLGTCRMGAIIVGRDCPVYRGGTYTLMSLVGSLLPQATANQLRGGMGIVGPILVAAFTPLVWRADALRVSRWSIPRWLACTCLALLVGVSTGMVGAVANGNMGTAFGAAALAVLIAWACASADHPGLKAAGLGVAAGLAAHLYGEGAVYACFVAALGVLNDAVRTRRLHWIASGGVISLACFLLTENVLLLDLIESLLGIGGMVTAMKWRAWYLAASPITWFAAPFTGIQMDGAQLVHPLELAGGFVMAGGILLLGIRRSRWLVPVGLAFLTASLVLYLERTQYEYGEHKILQLLGPMWTTLLVGLSYRALASQSAATWERYCALVLIGVTGSVSAHFTWQAHAALLRRIPERALTLRFDDGIVDAIRAGDEIVVDPSAVMNTDRFIKQDYATMLAHVRHARVLLSKRVDDSIPPHTQFPRTDTFRRADSPDWLIRIRSADSTSVLNQDLPVQYASPGEYELISLKGKRPVVLSASGWYPCESGHCWTSGTYELEAFVPAACSMGELTVRQTLHAPPEAGLVDVSVNGVHLSKHPATPSGVLRIPLPRGWSTISVAPEWSVTSPSELGQSSDPRKLFAAIEGGNVRCIDAGPSQKR
ncbi:hypothetical protein [Lysobacter arvi]|uniref:Glycosyltransferase RgtA/B/C/D-like domain-containing protein n=1 Tax=Lysobacter arvi TaxID=3038776 RepID=A0ABU1CFB7_9GAMM|nr:hypothetical protein [Lysobacter arvi]MDR0183634.1 hypothetical protein [Lysobacter arvi]